MEIEMTPTTITKEIKDSLTRSVLISAAENLEKMLSTQQITMETSINTTTELGLRIDVTIKQPSENAVPIYTFMYMLDTLKFKEYLEEHKCLLEGPAIFSHKGLRITVISLEKWDKTGFSIDDKREPEGEKFLPLMHQEVKFMIHRDLAHRKEWCVYLEDPAFAAQTQEDE